MTDQKTIIHTHTHTHTHTYIYIYIEVIFFVDFDITTANQHKWISLILKKKKKS